jgi:hypothetical protein
VTGYTDEYLDLYDLTVAQILGPWNYTAYIYVAFDPPTATSPTWVNVTQYVDLQKSTISMTRGRQDGLSDVNVGTCSLSVDNTDGRWTPTNAAGAWFGKIHKGNWLRIDALPPSGTVSTRFVGFITGLPTAWDGLYANTKISASDRFLLLGQAPQFDTMVEQESLADNAGDLQCYYALIESSSSPSIGDTSGQSNGPMTQQAIGGVPLGAGLSLGSTQGPGFDGQQAPSFTPISTTQGTCLTTTLPAAGSTVWGTKVSCWVNTTYQNAYNPIFSLVDPVSGAVVTVMIDIQGTVLDVLYTWLSPGGPTATVLFEAFNGGLAAALPQLNDGRWHFVTVILWPYGGARGAASGWVAGASWLDVFQDGIHVTDTFGTTNPPFGAGAINPSTAMTQLIVGGGMSFPTRSLIGTFSGSISDVEVSYAETQAQGIAMLSEPPLIYAAANPGFAGERADQRISRFARYAGVPEPSWTNLASCIHLAGTQSISGRQPLDVMREAARTEGMPLYIDRSGHLTIQPCTTRYGASSSWSVNALDVENNTAFADDFQYLVNQVGVTANGGTTQTINGATGYASQAKYGVYNQSLQTASLNTDEAANAGLGVIGANSDPVPRIAPLVIEAATLATQTGYGASWYDAVLATDISTVVTVTNLPAQAPASSMSVFVEGYTETLGMGQHTFSFSTSPQTYTNAIQLDSPTLGLLDDPALVLAY